MKKYVFTAFVFVFLVISNNWIYSQDNSYFIKKSGKFLGNNYFSSAKYYRINNDTSKFLPHTFYIKLKSSSNDLSFLKQIEQFNKLESVSINKPFATNQKNESLLSKEQNLSLIYQIHYSSNENPFDLCKLLNDVEFIEYASPVFRQKLAEFVPNDANYAMQWGLKKLQMEKAWEISMGDTNIVIGLIDSGTDIEHIDLKNKIKFNPNEIPFDNIDNDDNGFVDDYMGWDFVGNISYNDAVQNKFKPDNNCKPLVSTNSHGTHTAGIIAAESNNKIGISGVSFNCKFMPVKVGMDDMETPNGSSDIFFGYEAVLYCVRMGCDIINMSWEVLGYSPIEEEIIDYAAQSGVVLVAAAGNSNLWSDKFKTYPAQYPGVITVGAVDEFEKKSSFTNFGYEVDIYAPGSSIYSTLPNSSYGNKSGTSMATPFVSGAIALLKSIQPNWTPEQIRHQLRATADNSIQPNTALEPFLFGRMNVYNLLRFNNQNFPEFKSPGISISEIQLKDADELNNFDTIDVKFILKNYLSATNNIEVELETGDLALNIYKKKHLIADFPENSEIELIVPVQITDRNLWYKGNALVTVHIKGENYRNYQLIEIPISLPSYNKYFVAYDLPDDLGLSFFAGDSKSDFHVAAIANAGQANNSGYLLNYGSVVDLKKLPGKANCIFSINQNENMIGSSGKIYITNLSDVKTIDVSSIADNIFAIHFFDNIIGYFAGIKSNRMVVGKSIDGGQTWNKVQIPSFSGSESHNLQTNLFSVKDSILFFTSESGKYAYSLDYGNTWNTGVIPNKSKVMFASIASRNSILIISNENNEYQLSFSKDFKNWENYSTKLNIDNIVHLFSPDSSTAYYMLGSHNEVYESIDMGINWNVLLSQEYAYSTCSAGAGFLKKDGRVRLWNFTSDLTYLDFDNKPVNIYKNLTNLSEKTLDFGKLKKDSTAIKFLFFKNNGNYRTTINKVTITPTDNFSKDKFFIHKQLSSTIASGTIENIQIGFSGNINGEYKAMLEIFSDADTSIHKIELIATVEDTSGSAILINQNEKFKIQNDNNSIYIIFEENNFDEIKQINIYDLNGRTISFEQTNNFNTIVINPTNFINSIYFIELVYNQSKLIIPFLKI